MFHAGDPCSGFHIVFARALADTLLLHVAKHRVFSELAGDPAFSRKVLSGLSRRLHGLVQDVEAYSLRSSAGKSVVASRLNMTPEHSLMQIKTGTCYQVQNLIYRMDEQKQTRLKRLLQRIGAGIVQDVPPELYACEICRRTRCVQDEWIVCESRIAHAKCLEEVMDKEQS